MLGENLSSFPTDDILEGKLWRVSEKIDGVRRMFHKNEQGVVTADAAIEMLKTHKLFNQLSFHTVKVIPLLKFTESIEV